MTRKKGTVIAAMAVAAAVSFWAGSALRQAQIDDQCLDLGGGRNPGPYPVCVVEQPNTALWLGPIRITQNDVVELELQHGVDGQSQVHLVLTAEIASPISAFTKQSIGQNMDIRIGGQLANTVRISDAVQGTSFILALSETHAEQLKALLTRDKN